MYVLAFVDHQCDAVSSNRSLQMSFSKTGISKIVLVGSTILSSPDHVHLRETSAESVGRKTTCSVGGS